MPRSVLLILVAFLTGCAHYEYNIIQPDDLRAHIGSKIDHVITRDPLEYHFRSYDNRLVIRVFDHTNEPITLVGDRSTAVDPKGQSHPLRSQTIAPQSYVKLILPPIRPRIDTVGPTFGIGIGTRVDARDERAPFPHGYDPNYLVAYGEDEVYYWDWPGESDVSLTLVFRRADKEFQQAFTFHRQKM